MMRGVLLVAAVALAISSAASAETIRLHWVETTTAGYPAMTFEVTSVNVARSSWSVRASVTNRSRGNIRILTEPSPYLSYRFGLFVPTTRFRHGLPEKLSHNTTWLAAVAFAPPLPSVLHHGETWSGTFSGRGALPRARPISVTFGAFASAELGDFSWTTAHAFTL